MNVSHRQRQTRLNVTIVVVLSLVFIGFVA